jgi:CubicO group peptidase (beta-lactamase class C family)
LPIEEKATLQNLIMSRSGIYLETDPNAPGKGSQAPDAQFYYNNWDFNTAGTAFEKMSGRNIYDALETDLARPLGMQDYDRAKQKKIQDPYCPREAYLQAPRICHVSFETRHGEARLADAASGHREEC